MASKRIEGIDAVRGLAALYVMLFHCFDSVHAHFTLARALIGIGGGWGVELFFCASGFLILGSYSRRAAHEASPKRNFYIRRFFRIVPLWWAILLVQFFGGFFSHQVLLANMFFYFGFIFYKPGYLPIIPSWSLFIEEVFYAIFPHIYRFLNRLNALRLLFLTYLISALWKQFAMPAGVPTANGFIERSAPFYFQFFFLGIILYQTFCDPQVWGRVNRLAGDGRWITWLDAVTGALFVATAFGAPIPHEVTVVLVLTAVLLPQTLIHRALNRRWLRWVGVRCYCIYILHVVVLMRATLVDYLILHWHLTSSWPEVKTLLVYVPVIGGTTIAIAAFSFIFLEKPFLRLGNQLIERLEAKTEPEPRPAAVPS